MRQTRQLSKVFPPLQKYQPVDQVGIEVEMHDDAMGSKVIRIICGLV